MLAASKHKPCQPPMRHMATATVKIRHVRGLILAMLALLAMLPACAQSRQEADMLAPHVVPPEPPSLLTPAGDRTPVPAPSTAPATREPEVVSNARPSTASARNAPPAGPPPTPTQVAVAPLGARGYLDPIAHEYETWNNCAPVTAEMVLSFYGIRKTQKDIAPVLRPNAKNFSVRMEQIGGYLGQFGLDSRPFVGGSLNVLKAFISNGIPVVVEDQLSLQEDYGHFRVVRGYDDAAGVVIFGDSYYGPANRLSYNLYTELWKRHNYAFMPVYKPSQQPLVQAILGPDFDVRTNLQDALAAAREAVAEQPGDGFAWLNLGDDLYRLDQYSDALAAWEHAHALQLTPRTLWYTIWPAAAYNHLGQYQQALNVVAIPLASDPNNAEALLERGNAYRGLGNKAKALSDYALAAEVDPSLAPAKEALAALQGA